MEAGRPRLVPSAFSGVFYGWWIACGGFVLQALSGGLLSHSFGAYFVHLQAEFGWSRTLVSGAFSLMRLEGGFLGPIQGWLITRFGPRTVIYVGLVIFAAGFFIFSQVDSVLSFYGAFLIIAVGSSLAGFMTVNIVLVNWFERRRARAMSMCSMGFGLAGLTVPVVVWALNTFGWRTTAVYSGVLLLVIGLPVARLFHPAPEPFGYEPDGVARRPVSADQKSGVRAPAAPHAGLTAREALRTPAFWLLTSGHTAALFAVASLTVHLFPYLVSERHTSDATAATAVACMTGASVVGQLIGGYLGDRFEKRWITAGCMAGHTAALLILIMTSTVVPIVVGAVVHGLSWGVRGPLMMAIRADYFGRRAFATIEGFAAIVTTVGVFIGPLTVGFLADQLGSYQAGFVFLSCITTAGFFFFATARRPAPAAATLPTGAGGR